MIGTDGGGPAVTVKGDPRIVCKVVIICSHLATCHVFMHLSPATLNVFSKYMDFHLFKARNMCENNLNLRASQFVNESSADTLPLS